MDDLNETGGTTANVRAVVRALKILESFKEKPLQSLSEVASRTELDKGTTRRLLLTLMSCGFVAQDSISQRYGLGRAVRALAGSVLDNFDLRSVAVPILNEIATDLHMTTFLSVYKQGEALCLERLHDMSGMEIHWWPVGGTLPLHSGGAPKLLLAFQDDAEIERVLSGTLQPLTEKTETDPEVLRAHLIQIRAQGWEIAIDDVMLGLTAVAVPVLDADGQIICAISMAGLTPQIVGENETVHVQRLLNAGQKIRHALGIAGS